jgi:hypothetical protein
MPCALITTHSFNDTQHNTLTHITHHSQAWKKNLVKPKADTRVQTEVSPLALPVSLSLAL